MLYSLGRWAYRSRRLVLSLWIAALVVLGGSALAFNQGTDDAFSIPGTESQEALNDLSHTFPQVSGTSAQIVVVAPGGEQVTDADIKATVESSLKSLDKLDQVSAAASPYDTTIKGTISDDKSAAVISVQLDGGQASITAETKDDLIAATDDLREALPADATVAIGGQLFSQDLPSLSIVELLGVAIAMVVLILTLGSFVAAGMPLLNALLGVGISMTLIFIATVFGPISSTTPMLALMLGLAVGIDYALFVISRHQEQLKDGLDPEESAARSVATAGSAVIFAGLTVIIALLGLTVANIPFLSVMGIAAAAAVAVAVLISITLTPALLGFSGLKILPKKQRLALQSQNATGTKDAQYTEAPTNLPGNSAANAQQTTGQLTDADRAFADAGDTVSLDAAAEVGASAASSSTGAGSQTEPVDDLKPKGFFGGWVRAVTRFPIVTILAVVGVLGLASIPALDLRLALPDAGSLPKDNSARITYDLLSENFGEGFNGPLIVTGSIVSSTDPVGLMNDIGNEISKLDGVAEVPLATPNMSADTGIVQVIPTGSPDSEETKALVNEIRGLNQHFQDTYNIDLSVTGFTAVGIDISDRLGGALLPFGILVVGLSLVLLTMVFRSIAVPIKATLGYLLSVGASFGAVAAVFEWGWFSDALHVANLGPVLSFMPILLMGVLFGLAMDYEVFLVSRIREEYVHGGNAQKAIRKGFVGSARVVTAAAVIMFAVFAAFVPEGDSSIKPIALGLAVGVFVDAFIVRMTLVPAVLAVLGDKAWWMPRWLDRILPSFDVEGENLHHELALAQWPTPGTNAAVSAYELSLPINGDTADTTADTLFDNVSFEIAPNGILVLTGATPAARQGLLLTLAGRIADFNGQLKVTGRVLPQRASAVRSRAAVVLTSSSPSPLSDLRDAFAERPQLVLVEGADTLLSSIGADTLTTILSDARRDATAANKPLAIVLSCSNTALLLEALNSLDQPGNEHTADAITLLDLSAATAPHTLEKVL
nr:MMPL family transporter [Lysinibacter cavernae]